MTPHSLQRRTVLRGLLAAGCALCLPLAAGCERAPSPGANAANTPPPDSPPPGSPPHDSDVGQAPSAMPPGTSAQSGGAGQAGESAGIKLSQVAAQYQDEPKGDQSCHKCMHFISESGTCKVVEGQVSPRGWCNLWVRKLS